MIKPADNIEWTYKKTGNLVVEDEMLWSSVTNSWCQIGSGFIHTCIAYDGKIITWLNSKGLFHARVDDTSGAGGSGFFPTVIPRARG